MTHDDKVFWSLLLIAFFAGVLCTIGIGIAILGRTITEAAVSKGILAIGVVIILTGAFWLWEK